MAEQRRQEDNGARLAQALSELDERSQDIIQARWLGDRKATLHQLAERYEVSAERIRQIEKNAFKRLASALEPAA